MRESSQSKRERTGYAIIRIILSSVVICVSIFAIWFVWTKVKEIKILEKINLKEEKHNSLLITADDNVGNSLFVTDDKGLKFRKEDKSFARDEWIEKNGELFYFDTAGYGINGTLKNEGQVYTFENGKLKAIKRDTSYVHRADENLFSSIESNQFLVWLADEKDEKGFYPIKYRQFSDDYEDYLGGVLDKQYSTPGMLKIYMSNIYYLSAGKGTSYAGHLYRMRPGASHKETVGVAVIGYVVLSDDVVYYYDGQRVMKARKWTGIDIVEPDESTQEVLDALSTLPSVGNSDINESIEVEDLVDTKALDENVDLPMPDSIDDIKPIEQENVQETTKQNLPFSWWPFGNDNNLNTRDGGPISSQIKEPTAAPEPQYNSFSGPIAVEAPGGPR